MANVAAGRKLQMEGTEGSLSDGRHGGFRQGSKAQRVPPAMEGSSPLPFVSGRGKSSEQKPEMKKPVEGETPPRTRGHVHPKAGARGAWEESETEQEGPGEETVDGEGPTQASQHLQGRVGGLPPEAHAAPSRLHSGPLALQSVKEQSHQTLGSFRPLSSRGGLWEVGNGRAACLVVAAAPAQAFSPARAVACRGGSSTSCHERLASVQQVRLRGDHTARCRLPERSRAFS